MDKMIKSVLLLALGIFLAVMSFNNILYHDNCGSTPWYEVIYYPGGSTVTRTCWEINETDKAENPILVYFSVPAILVGLLFFYGAVTHREIPQKEMYSSIGGSIVALLIHLLFFEKYRGSLLAVILSISCIIVFWIFLKKDLIIISDKKN